MSQAYGLSPVCVRKCNRTPDDVRNAFPHTEHLHGSSFLWIISGGADSPIDWTADHIPCIRAAENSYEFPKCDSSKCVGWQILSRRCDIRIFCQCSSSSLRESGRYEFLANASIGNWPCCMWDIRDQNVGYLFQLCQCLLARWTIGMHDIGRLIDDIRIVDRPETNFCISDNRIAWNGWRCECFGLLGWRISHRTYRTGIEIPPVLPHLNTLFGENIRFVSFFSLNTFYKIAANNVPSNGSYLLPPQESIQFQRRQNCKLLFWLFPR